MQNLNSTAGDEMQEAEAIVNQHHPQDSDNKIQFNDEEDDESLMKSWNFSLRELRHNPCVMRPVSALVLVLFSISTLITLLFQIPTFVLGLIMAPVLNRTYWFVEFLYPMGIARWAHLYLIRMNSRNRAENNKKKKSKGPEPDSAAAQQNRPRELPKAHSRCIEQRVEVVKERVYIHPIPQLLDNLGYLVVCLPPRGASHQIPMVACLVDCGDAHACTDYIEIIRQTHYPSHVRAPLELQSILCTHKHHDHTAGNYEMMNKLNSNNILKYIYGGAVERVPYCNRHVINGDLLELPCAQGNDMNDFVTVEVIVVPCHTRGSVVYALRAKSSSQEGSSRSGITADEDYTSAPLSLPSPAFLFTGDTMFSGGGGVPFEADTEYKSDHSLSKKDGNSPIRPTAGSHALERCFAEILTRSASTIGDETAATQKTIMDNILVFPGHEYTNELLNRQFSPTQTAKMEESCQWSKLPPSTFFEIASNLYVANHRRTLPKKGKLLNVPSTLSRELVINPYFRIMKRRGQHVVNAIKLWHRYFAKKTLDDIRKGQHNVAQVNGIPMKASFSGMALASSSLSQQGLELSNPVYSRSSSQNASSVDGNDDDDDNKRSLERVSKTPSTSSSWNMVASDFTTPVFTTVYSADLKNVIQGLTNQEMDPSTAVQLLTDMQRKLEIPPVGRRPIPATLPTGKTIYQGLLGLTLLGSRPSALTLSDSRIMKLPAPHQDNDRLRISKTRLINVLSSLELLTEENYGKDIILMIHLLWAEAEAYNCTAAQQEKEVASLNAKPTDKQNYNATSSDLESNGNAVTRTPTDEVELGVLKWIIYGVELHPSWFSKFCMPCGGKNKKNRTPTLRRLDNDDTPHPITTCNMRRSNGELVRHDVETCPVCLSLVEGSSSDATTTADNTSSSNNQGTSGGIATSQIPPPLPLSSSLLLPSHGSSIIGDSSSEVPSDEGEEAEGDGVELEVNVNKFMLGEPTANETYFDENVGDMRPTRSW